LLEKRVLDCNDCKKSKCKQIHWTHLDLVVEVVGCALGDERQQVSADAMLQTVLKVIKADAVHPHQTPANNAGLLPGTTSARKA
jgi:hypothetical protein